MILSVLTLAVREVPCRRYDCTFVTEMSVFVYEIELLFKRLIARIGCQNTCRHDD